MRHPDVSYVLDPVVSDFLEQVTCFSKQEVMIGTEICVDLGFASCEFHKDGRDVAMKIKGTQALRDRLRELNEPLRKQHL